MENQMNQNAKQEVRLLYQNLLNNWNNHLAGDFANLFAEDGNTIGFDGSQMNGRKEIEKEISAIFNNHPVSSYVGIVREVRALASDAWLLRAVVGMIPPGKSTIKPDVNAIQTLIAQRDNTQLRIALFQNTPAAFHGRPELSEQLTKELQEAYDKQ